LAGAWRARQDLLDLDAGTLAIEITRVVDGRVIKSDGKTKNATARQERSARPSARPVSRWPR
jgi:hypothetical protein